MDLIEILKKVPKGTMLYSPICGEVTFLGVSSIYNENTPKDSPVINTEFGGKQYYFTREGKAYTGRAGDNAEVMIFPSKDQRNWNKFADSLREPTKLKRGHPVLVSDNGFQWRVQHYSGFTNVCFEEGIEVGILWKYIVAFEDFNWNDIKSNKDRSIW